MKIIIEEKAREMLEKKLEPGQFLRIGVTEGGCAGLTYNADIAGEMKEGDIARSGLELPQAGHLQISSAHGEPGRDGRNQEKRREQTRQLTR